MSALLPVRSLLAATALTLLLSACSTAYYTGDTISGPAQRLKRDADGNCMTRSSTPRTGL